MRLATSTKRPARRAPSPAAIALAAVAYPGGALAAGTLPVAALGGDWVAGVPILGVALALFALTRLVRWFPPEGAKPIVFAVCAAVFVTSMLALFHARDSILSDRGEATVAVADPDRAVQRGTHTCHLAATDGTPIRPAMWSGACTRVLMGAQIEVTYDPEGKAPPKPGAPDTGPGVFLSISLTGALVAATGVRARARHRHQSADIEHDVAVADAAPGPRDDHDPTDLSADSGRHARPWAWWRRSRRSVSPTIAAVIVVVLPAVVFGLGYLPYATWGGDAAFWAVFGAVAVAAGLGLVAATRVGAGAVATIAALGVAALSPVVHSEYVQARILDDRGERVEAEVVHRHGQASRYRTTYRCLLARPDGTLILPTMTGLFGIELGSGTCEELRVGDQVRVTYDPDGRVPPRPGSVRPNVLWPIGTWVTLAALLAAGGIFGRRRTDEGSRVQRWLSSMFDSALDAVREPGAAGRGTGSSDSEPVEPGPGQ